MVFADSFGVKNEPVVAGMDVNESLCSSVSNG